MAKQARKWSYVVTAVAVSGLIFSPASAKPVDSPPAEVKIEAATDLLPGGLKARAKSYLAPAPLSSPDTLLLTQLNKISTEKIAQDKAAKKALAAEKAAQAKKAADKAAAKKKAAAKAAADKVAADKIAAEKKAAADKAAAKKAATSKKAPEENPATEAAAAQQASNPPQKTTQTPSNSNSSHKKSNSGPPPVVTVPNGNGIECGPPSGDSNLQQWPAMVRTRVAKQFGINTIGGYRPTASGEHGKGLALDVMTYSNSAKGNQVLQWVIEHHSELNVYYVIFEQKIYGDWTGWRGKPMEDRGDVTANHFDHVHISFNPGMGTCPAN